MIERHHAVEPSFDLEGTERPSKITIETWLQRYNYIVHPGSAHSLPRTTKFFIGFSPDHHRWVLEVLGQGLSPNKSNDSKV